MTFRANLDVLSDNSLCELLIRFMFAAGILFGGLISIGSFLLHQEMGAWISLCVAVLSIVALRQKKLEKYLLGQLNTKQ